MSGKNFSVDLGNAGASSFKVDNDSSSFRGSTIKVNDSEQEFRMSPTQQDIRNEAPQLKKREKVVLSKGGFGKSMRTLYNKLSAKTEAGRKRRQENAQNYLKLVDEVIQKFGFDSPDSISIKPGTELHSNWIKCKAGHGRNAEVTESTKKHIMRDLKKPVIFALLGEFAKMYGRNFDNAKDLDSMKEIFALLPKEVSTGLEKCLNDPTATLTPELVNSFRRNVSIDSIKQNLNSNIYGDESNFPEKLTKLFNEAENGTKSGINSDELLHNAQNIIESDLAERNGVYVDQVLEQFDGVLSKMGVSKDDSEIKAIFEEAEEAKTSNYLLSKDNNWLTELNGKFKSYFDKSNTATVDLIKQNLNLSNIYGDDSNLPEELTNAFSVAGGVSEKIFKIDEGKFLAYTQSIIKSDLAKRNNAYVDQALKYIDDLLSKAGVSKDDLEIKFIFAGAKKAKTSNYLLSKDNNWLTELNKKFELYFKPVREKNANAVNLVKQRLGLSDIYGDESNLPKELTNIFVAARNDIKPVGINELLSKARNVLNREYVDKIINNTRAFFKRIGLREENNDFKISLNESGLTIENILAEAEKGKESGSLLSKNNKWLNAFNEQINKAVTAIVPKKNRQTVDNLIKEIEEEEKDEVPPDVVKEFRQRAEKSNSIVNFSKEDINKAIIEHKLKLLQE